MLCALIMAGGKGTRFWPASTNDKPKQFLNLIGEETMIQMTVHRLLPLIPMERIFICTGKEYVDLVLEQLPELPKRNIIIEPTGRNTAPCILLSTLYIKQIYNDVKIAVLPSDHVINNEVEFLNILDTTSKYLDENNKAILTIGITPTRPETGYGYIKQQNKLMTINDKDIYKVERFVEKPNFETALVYLNEGHYLWNAGMFVFNTETMINEFKLYANDVYEVLSKLPSIDDENYQNVLNDIYCDCRAISVDYAIMENSKEICVLPGDFGWDDVGAWKALERYMHEDQNENITKGHIHLENCHQSIIYASDKTIIVDGLDDIYCIQSGDYIIIGKKENLNKVHEFRGKF